MKKKIIFLYFVFVSILVAKADQDTVTYYGGGTVIYSNPGLLKSRHIDLGLGMNYGLILDQTVSPNLYYSVSLPSLLIAYKSKSDEKIYRTQVLYQTIKNYNKKDVGSFLDPLQQHKRFSTLPFLEVYDDVLYCILGKILKDSNNKVYLGFHSQFTVIANLVTNYSNSASNFYSFLDLGPKAELDYNFKLFKKTLTLNYSLSIPLIAGYCLISANYPSVVALNNDFIGRYLRINSETNLEYNLSNKNKISLGYRWQYLSSSKNATGHQLQITNNYITIKLCYAL